MIEVRSEASRISPIAEAICVVFRIASDHSDEGEAKKDENKNDLASRQPEFSLTIKLDGKTIKSSESRSANAQDEMQPLTGRERCTLSRLQLLERHLTRI